MQHYNARSGITMSHNNETMSKWQLMAAVLVIVACVGIRVYMGLQHHQEGSTARIESTGTEDTTGVPTGDFEIVTENGVRILKMR